MRQRTLIAAVVPFSLLVVACAFEPLDSFARNNPADPNSANYAGHPVVDDPNDVQPQLVHDAEIILPLFIISGLSGADGYALEVATDELFSDESIIFSGEFTTPVMPGPAVDDLQPGVSYYWRARVRYQGSWQDFLPARRFTLVRGIELVAPEHRVVIRETHPTFQWRGVGSASAYEIQISEDRDSIGDAPSHIVDSSRFRIPTDLGTGATRYWRVRARAGDVTSLWSDIQSFSTWFSVGDTGPAGGYIAYVDEANTHGWTFLEAAPASTEILTTWGGYGRTVGGTRETVGSGRSNTERIVAVLGEQEPYSGSSTYAARYSALLEHNGYADWFLPSREELDKLYDSLHARGLGDFSFRYYWTSSEWDHQRVGSMNFDTGDRFGGSWKYHTHFGVRAVRTF